ncbi:hypothetical protein AB6N16_08060 [Pseudomonas marginalis]
MSDEIEVLKQLLDKGHLDNEDAKVSGIAKLAVDKGFEQLSAPQKAVIAPHLQRACEGVTDPGGYHNECQIVLDGKEFATALEQEGYYGSLLCENCINETEQYANEWDRINKE